MTEAVEQARQDSVPLAEALAERYLAYALSTITSRSLPDVRDGLKPVQRRLLHAMRQLRLEPREGFKKSARVVGDVIGKFHPHGDQSIYEALVRLAQDFAARHPLVDGQGNFGNVDGDNAAAMRYTEARLTDVAMAMLEGIDEDACDFRANYDGSDSEPVVLPARFPNLLANGSSGIAVGMATSIPPHNAAELCAALVHLIDRPRATVETLASLVPGPDFPTGGELADSAEAVREAYATGRGSFRLRATWRIEELARGRWQVVVAEIPWQVQKSRLVGRIAELIEARRLPLLEAVVDESTEDVRLVLVPKSRTVDAAVLMESLFRATELESRVALNLNVLEAGGVPRVMNLRDALLAFIEHRRDVLRRRSAFRLKKTVARLEVLEGYLVVYLNLDEVIRIVRDEDAPAAALRTRFGLSERQAEAVLDMRLRSLKRLEEAGIRAEKESLAARKAEIEALLASERRQQAALKAEFRETGTRFGDTAAGRRRTRIGTAPPPVDMPIDATVEREPVTVALSAKGWIRAVRGHGEQAGGLRYKEGDGERFRVEVHTTDRLLLFASNGRFYTLAVADLPGGRGYGDPVRLMLELGNDVEIQSLLPFRGGRRLLVASSGGHGFVVPEDQVCAQTRAGKQVLNLKPGAEALLARPVVGDHVAVVGENRRLLIFPLAELPELTRGRGVILQRYRSGGLADAKCFPLASGLTWRSGSRTRTHADLDGWLGGRGQAGRPAPAGFASGNRFGDA